MTIIEQIEQREVALTVSELAKLLNVSARAIYLHVSEGRLPSIKIGSTVRLDPQEVAEWLRKRST